nr:hypothetical protein [Candidatus Electrothrix aestuarii]
MNEPDIHHRRSIRLRNYDYTQAGAYFVTICIHHRARIFCLRYLPVQCRLNLVWS